MKDLKTKRDVELFVKNVDGWLSNKEGRALYDLAKECKQGIIVEIGSWKGKSTIWLGTGSKAGRNIPVHAIDPHSGSVEHKINKEKISTFSEFKNNITRAGLMDIIIPHVQTSQEAAKDIDQPVGLVFIDGSHEYELVKLDFELWFPKVIEGGFMVFDDTRGWVGPHKVVVDRIYKSRHFKNIHTIGKMTVAQKVKNNTFIDRLNNRLSLIYLQLQYFFLSLIGKVINADQM